MSELDILRETLKTLVSPETEFGISKDLTSVTSAPQSAFRDRVLAELSRKAATAAARPAPKPAETPAQDKATSIPSAAEETAPVTTPTRFPASAYPLPAGYNGVGPWIEPVGNRIAPPATTTPTNPLTVADALIQQQAEGLKKARDDQIATLEQSLIPEKESLQRNYKLDRRFIEESNIPVEQQKEKIRQLDYQQQKKLLALDDKIRGDRDTVMAAYQKAAADQAARAFAIRTKQQVYADEVAAGRMDPATAERLQYEAAGLKAPAPKVSTPQQALAAVTSGRKSLQQDMGLFREVPSRMRWGQRLEPAKLMILKPEYRDDPAWREADYSLQPEVFQPATLGEIRQYGQLKTGLRDLINKEWEYRNQILGRVIPSLSLAEQTTSPLAASIRSEMPKPNTEVDVSQMTDAELEQLAGLR